MAEEQTVIEERQSGQRCLLGRKKLTASCEEVNEQNVLKVLKRAMLGHMLNCADIDYLYRYYLGAQPVLQRKKTVRPEICNKIVENHAQEIVNFHTGYLLGEPCTYVRRGSDDKVTAHIELLNDTMFAEDKASGDRELCQWMQIAGVGYRMVLPDQEGKADESPIEMEVLDPRYAFVVYHSGFGSRPLMGVKYIKNDKGELVYSVYTENQCFEICNDRFVQDTPKANPLGRVPIVEYALNPERMGAFEPALPLLDAINSVASNRVDGVEQFVQSFMKFINCDIDEEKFRALKELGAIKIKSIDGQTADVEIVTSELNQQQTQVLVDWLYDQALVICGVPSSKGSAAATSDNVGAVIVRNGWQQAEARAKQAEQMFKKSEKQFLKVVLSILRKVQNGFSLRLADIDVKFTRRQYENLQAKCQALLSMLQAGISPEVAIAHCGLFNDPQDVFAQSQTYLTKWRPNAEEKTPQPQPETRIDGEGDAI